MCFCGLNCVKQRFWSHQHSGAAPVGIIVHAFVRIFRVAPYVVYDYLNQTVFTGTAYHSLIEGGVKHFWEDGENMKFHLVASDYGVLGSRPCPTGSSCERGLCVRHPLIISKACGIIGSITSIHSLTPAGLPGRFMIRQPDLTPETDLLNMAYGVDFDVIVLMASVMPGISMSSTASGAVKSMEILRNIIHFQPWAEILENSHVRR